MYQQGISNIGKKEGWEAERKKENEEGKKKRNAFLDTFCFQSSKEICLGL